MNEFEELNDWEDVRVASDDDDDAPEQQPLSSENKQKRDRHGFVLSDEAFQELRCYTAKYLYEYPKRVERWRRLLGSEQLLQNNPGEYKRLLGCEDQMQFKVVRQIRVDISRTFPQSTFFKEIDGDSKLQRILSAYSIRNTEVGYCQGMNYIVGFLLLIESEHNNVLGNKTVVSEFDIEETVFWSLVCIVEHKSYNKGYYLSWSNMFALKLDCLVLKRLTKQLQPLVYSRIAEFPKCPVFMVLSASWFITLFIDSLPSEALIKVWDAYVFEGKVVLFRVAIAILRMCEDDILNASDVNIISVTRQRAKTMFNCEELLQTAFGTEIVSAVSDDVINETKNDVYKDIVAAYQTNMSWWEYCGGSRPAHLKQPPGTVQSKRGCCIS